MRKVLIWCLTIFCTVACQNISFITDYSNLELLDSPTSNTTAPKRFKRQRVIANLRGEVLGLRGNGPWPEDKEPGYGRFNFQYYINSLPRNSQLYRFITQSGGPVSIPISELHLIAPLRRYQLSLGNKWDYQFYRRADGTRSKIEFNHPCPYNCEEARALN